MKITPTTSFLLAFGACVAYDKLVPRDMKDRWENWIRSHHGTWGVGGIIVGTLTESPNLIAAGSALAIHDIKDAPWIKDSGN